MLARRPVVGQEPPSGFIPMNVPGARPAWVDGELGRKIVELMGNGRLMEARTLLLWFGGEAIDE